MAEWSIARDSPGKSAGRNAMGRAATAASLILRFDGPSELIELRKERAELQPLAGPRPFAPKGGTPPPFASSPGRPQDRPPLPSPLADLVNTLGGQILTLNGFVNRYSQVKWIFSTKLAQHKALILLKLNSHAKMAPDSRAADTGMTSRPELMFPNDMRQAMGLTGIPLAFSTIQPGDTNPYRGGRGGAEGSVGIIVDIGPATVIHSVGSHLEVRNRYQGHLEDWHLIMSGRILRLDGFAEWALA